MTPMPTTMQDNARRKNCTSTYKALWLINQMPQNELVQNNSTFLIHLNSPMGLTQHYNRNSDCYCWYLICHKLVQFCDQPVNIKPTYDFQFISVDVLKLRLKFTELKKKIDK